jgi:spore coat protein A, manganese oxidase
MKKFLLLGLILLTAGIFVAAGGTANSVYGFAQSPALTKFIQPIRGLGGATGIPVAASDGTRSWPGVTATHYTISINQFEDLLHPELANPTRLWGYGGLATGNVSRHLGGIIVAEKGKPVQITFQNNLPPTHILPVDTSIPGAEVQQNRTATHIHGGLVPWISDGGPFDWWTPDGKHGASFLNNQVLRPAEFLANTIPANEAEYYYPNNQSARLVWYHDHAFGITRLNAYSGVASAYAITDWYETLLSKFPFSIPGPLDARTLYLVFQDKIFYTGTTGPDGVPIAKGNDPDGYPVPNARSGDLWYAHVYDPDRWTVDPANTTGGPASLPDPNKSVIAEFFGDTILVNGSVYPYVELEQREYRLRMLNACNARFLNPRIVKAKSDNLASADSKEPLTYSTPATVAGFVQIASEGGYLPYPAYLNAPGRPQLMMAPAERTDLIVDLRNVKPGIYLLYNDAAAPNPGGDVVNDYYPGSPNPTVSTPGYGPNTRTLLQIRVKARVGKADLPIWVPPIFTPTDPFLIFQKPGVPAPNPVVNNQGYAQVTLWTTKKVMAKVRQLTLNEDFDKYGRLIQFLGTNQSTGPGAFGIEYTATPTEVAANGTYEIWEIANLTGDVHPIHFHLVNVQVLNRQNFNATAYNGTPAFTSIPFAPDANELGYKETVRMNPNQVTRVLMKIDLAKVPFNVPTSPRLAAPAGATKAHEFVWHCHILEHEEHDMMRPFVVYE